MRVRSGDFMSTVMRLWVVVVMVALQSGDGRPWASSASFSAPGHDQWTSYKVRFNKTYGNSLEDQARKSVFLQSMRRIDLHNAFHRAGYESFEMEVNYFADWLPSERERVLGIKGEGRLPQATVLHRPHAFSAPDGNASIPDTIDWRERGAVTPVKNQGQCGSCWAFSTVGAVESQHYLATGELVALSEQNLMDCDRTDAGCHGGDVFRAFNFMIKQGGVDTQATYPYHFTPERCHFRTQDVGATVLGYEQVPSGDEEALKRVVAITGPVTAIMDANISLFAYKRGVLTVKNCSKVDANHGVVIIGYGREGDKDYWLVKNSWSTMWGDEGYFKIERNVNMCGIATNVTYPIVGADRGLLRHDPAATWPDASLLPGDLAHTFLT